MAAGGAPVKRGDEIQVAIDRLAYGGRGVGRHDGLVVFVAGAAPGDVVVARVEKVRRGYLEAAAVEVTAPSVDRVTPRCPHFGPCGGCTWQHIAYAAQARAKEAVVRESLAHLGGIRDAPVAPIVAAPDPWYYRNKMEFSFHPQGVLGLHCRGHWNRIVPVETCFLQSPASAALVNAVRLFARRHGLAPYDPVAHRGFLRSLVVREGRATGQRLVGLVTGEGSLPSAALVRAVRDADPDVTGIVRGIAGGVSDGAPLVRTDTLDGTGVLEEEVAGLRFCIGLDTFFQTNTPQAGRMVEHVVAAAAPVDGRLVVDLYCGVGTFTLALARAGGRAIGVERSPAAVEAARANSVLNGLRSATFVAGDARVVLPALVRAHGAPDVVVLDPPRAGAGGRVMRKIGRSRARRVIYVSCNPTTLAPDLRELLAFGYRLVEVQPFDLFPQTYHVEAIAVLDRHQEVEGDRP
jgi:23S rRNA (uracil1939-C5)-methyltransferase